jgi:hypothetical protein
MKVETGHDNTKARNGRGSARVFVLLWHLPSWYPISSRKPAPYGSMPVRLVSERRPAESALVTVSTSA